MRQELAEAALEGLGDVKDRAAVDIAVFVIPAGLDRQRSLSIDGSHAEKCDQPHPENRAGAAGKDRAGSADDVAGADLGSDRSSQCLERAHTALLRAAVKGKVSENLMHAFAEAAHLNEAGLDGVPEAHSNQQEHQNVVGQIRVDVGYDG